MRRVCMYPGVSLWSLSWSLCRSALSSGVWAISRGPLSLTSNVFLLLRSEISDSTRRDSLTYALYALPYRIGTSRLSCLSQGTTILTIDCYTKGLQCTDVTASIWLFVCTAAPEIMIGARRSVQIVCDT